MDSIAPLPSDPSLRLDVSFNAARTGDGEMLRRWRFISAHRRLVDRVQPVNAFRGSQRLTDNHFQLNLSE